MGQRMVGAQFDRALQMRGDLIHAIKAAPSERDIVMIFADPVVELDRFADEFRCGCGTAALQSEQSEIVQAVGVVGINRENIAVTALRLGKRPSLMLRHGCGEQARRCSAGKGNGGRAAHRRCPKRSGIRTLFATYDTDRRLKGTPIPAKSDGEKMAERKGFEPLIRL